MEGVGERDTGMFFTSETVVRSEVFGNYKVALITKILSFGLICLFLELFVCIYLL